MRINAIQNYSYGFKKYGTVKTISNETSKQPESTGSVAFKSAKAKGFGIGAIVGLAAATILTGGAATPALLAACATIEGAVGGTIGHIIDKADEES